MAPNVIYLWIRTLPTCPHCGQQAVWDTSMRPARRTERCTEWTVHCPAGDTWRVAARRHTMPKPRRTAAALILAGNVGPTGGGAA